MPTPQTDIYSHERAGFAERLGRLAARTTWREPASGAFTDRADKMPLEHALATALAFARQAPHDIGPDIAYAIVTMIEHRRPRIVGELTARLRNDARRVALVLHATRLIVDERGRPLRRDGLRYRFDAARVRAGVAFQFRDLRAKAATDKAEAQDMRQAQRQLGHASVVMTEAYVRARRGDKVTPTR